jgi:hypothetical protein
MATFVEANQARLSIKMKLSQYAWYGSSAVAMSPNDGYSVVIHVKNLNNTVRKIVPPVINGVSVKLDLE